MTGIGETTAALRRLRKASGMADLSERPGFEEIPSFGDNPGQLRMLSYAPTSLKSGAPLLVVLHGCAQNGTGYATSGGWRELADQLGCVVVAPEQSSNNNFNRCFNWFAPGDVRRGVGEAASIAAMVKHALRTFRADPRRVFITGLSAGGAMAGVMLATYPDLFAGGGIVAGLPYGVAQSVPDAMRIMHRADPWTSAQLGALVRQAAQGVLHQPRLTIWHGDADWTVDRANGLAVAKQWANVQGLSDAADEITEFAKFSRSIWRSPQSGQVAIEFNLVYDLGHGAPLSTAGPDGIGVSAPFMLEAGVSSTLEMARFWGLLGGEPLVLTAPKQPALTPPAKVKSRRRPLPIPIASDSGIGRQVLGSLAKVVSEDVTDVIAKAFKTAGLLKK